MNIDYKQIEFIHPAGSAHVSGTDWAVGRLSTVSPAT